MEHCNTEMELVETVTDYYDPSDYNGHGQRVEKVLVCPKCEYTEIYEEELYDA